MGFLSGLLGMIPGIGGALSTAADVAEKVINRPAGEGILQSLASQAPQIIKGVAGLARGVLPGPFGDIAEKVGDFAGGLAGQFIPGASKSEEKIQEVVEDEEPRYAKPRDLQAANNMPMMMGSMGPTRQFEVENVDFSPYGGGSLQAPNAIQRRVPMMGWNQFEPRRRELGEGDPTTGDSMQLERDRDIRSNLNS